MVLIKNKTRSDILEIGYEKIADFALGKDFELSLVFVGKKFIRNLNFNFRQKDKATNILSFPLTKKDGEIFICPLIARSEAKKINETYEEYFKYLFIHGITHLKGFEHGSKMEEEEERIRKNFLK